jgi:hypothetical protein
LQHQPINRQAAGAAETPSTSTAAPAPLPKESTIMPLNDCDRYGHPKCPTEGCALVAGHDEDCIWARLFIPVPGKVTGVAFWCRDRSGAVTVSVRRLSGSADPDTPARVLSPSAAAKLSLSCRPPAPFRVAPAVVSPGELVGSGVSG